MGWVKKNGTLAVAALVRELVEQTRSEVEDAGQLPDDACYDFDSADPQSGERPSRVEKTRCRTVKSLAYATFRSHETIRRNADGSRRSPELQTVVPNGSTYAYDLIALVGVLSFLQGRRLADIQEELARQKPALHVPISTLYEQRLKFLFYLGHLHRQAMPVLNDYFRQQGPIIWLIDGTVELDSPVFLGIHEPVSNILLFCRKIPTENIEDIAACLTAAAKQYGIPALILHDLSAMMSGACELALPQTPHKVCHFHFARDVGEGLYAGPQQALQRRLRALNIQVRLREQRKGQTKWMREKLEQGEAHLVLTNLLHDQAVTATWNESLTREVLFALHYWILDYAADGSRQGFPFDPHLLYLHRRLVYAGEALDRWLDHHMPTPAPRVLLNLRKNLNAYRQDAQIISAATWYEQAYQLFTCLRSALRLSAESANPLRESYSLSAEEQVEVIKSLEELKREFRERKESVSDQQEKKLYTVVLKHVEKYWDELQPLVTDLSGERTTNKLEGWWGEAKRSSRKIHGRRKLTRDLQSLPEEWMLVPNLNRPGYVEAVLGSLDRLPQKLAEAGRTAGPYSHWRCRQQPLKLGRLPKKLLRQDNFVDDLLAVYEDHCVNEKEQAA